MTPKNIEIKPCYHLDVSFDSTEGLNKFIEFLLQNKLSGFGFEKTSKNTIYAGVFTEEEINKVKKYLNYESKQK